MRTTMRMSSEMDVFLPMRVRSFSSRTLSVRSLLVKEWNDTYSTAELPLSALFAYFLEGMT